MENVLAYQLSNLSVQFSSRQNVLWESPTQLYALQTHTVEYILSRAVRLEEDQLVLNQHHQTLFDLWKHTELAT